MEEQTQILQRIKAEGDWTLFLDRDGTINRRLVGDYVRRPAQFEFLPGSLEAISSLSSIFKYIIVITNQQGIGKEIMTHEDLSDIHDQMTSEIQNAGGWIDEVYYCPDLAISDPPCRKPNPGMALQAKDEFNDINFKMSVMIGDAESDILFGKHLGMTTVWIESSPKASLSVQYDFKVDGLMDFARLLD